MITLSSQRVQALDKLLKTVMRDGKAVGLAVSAFDSEGNILYERFEGYRDREKKLRLDENTVLGLASITKSFTALAIMQLAEKGLLDPSAPVQRYVPEFRYPDITISHLLSHSAGFFPLSRMLVNDVAADMGLSYSKDGELARHPGLARESARRLIESMNSEDVMIGPPGDCFSYSNDGFALLSDIVMRVGGAPTYAEYLQDNVLLPLGMVCSGCDFEWPGEENITKLYQMEDGVMSDRHDFYDLAFALMGEGNMRSTIADMRRYVRMYLNRGMGPESRFISARNIEAMTRPRQVSGLNEYYGYGLNIEPEGDMTLISHGGNLTGVSSQIVWSYETGVGVVVISNTSNVPVSRVSTAVMRACAGMSPVARTVAPAIHSWPEALLNSARGEYVSREGMTLKLDVREGMPVLLLNGDEVKTTIANAYMLKMRYFALDLTIRLCLDDNGEVWALDAGLRIIPKSR